MTEKKRPDWERIEIDYRAGILSVREIAASQGVSHTAIQKRAKAEGWERDLNAKIKAKADALVAKREVAKKVSTEKLATERAIVEANAEVITEVRMKHRADIARCRNLCMSLISELEVETKDADLFEELGVLLRDPSQSNDKLNELYKRVTSSSGRIDSMKKLSETLKNLIGLEREAFGLDKAADVQVSITSTVNPQIDLSRLSDEELQTLERIAASNAGGNQEGKG